MKVSLHTAQVFIRSAPMGLTRGDGTPLGSHGTQPPRRCAPMGHSFEMHQPTGVGRHLLSQRTAVRGAFLPFQTRPTWAYPADYPQALAFSVFPRLRPRTRLAVRSARPQAGRGWQCSHVLQPSPGDLGSPYTPAVRVFASGHFGEPEPDCMPFGPSLISLFGLTQFTMLTGVHLVLTVSSNSSAPPD